MDANWVADGIAQFLRSPMWTAPVSNFVDDNCIFFDSEAEMKLEYTTIHKQFQELIDTLLTGYIGELGVSAEEALAVIKASDDATHMRLVEYLTYLDDFPSFKKLMEKRNAELEYQAMKALNLIDKEGAPAETTPAVASPDDEDYQLAVEESRTMADLIMKEAELEDLELQKVLALSLAMENERVAREKAAKDSAPTAEAPRAPTEAKSVEAMQQETMEARVKNLEEANKKIAQIIASPAKAPKPDNIPAPAAPATVTPTTTPTATAPSAAIVSDVAPQQASPASPPSSMPAVVRLTASDNVPVPTHALAPLGRKPVSDPSAFKVASITFKQLQESTPAPTTQLASPLAEVKGPSLEEMQRRAADLKKQRDLIIAMKKKERNEELQAATGKASQPETSNRDEELARQKQMAVDIARRFRDDIVGESRK